MARYISCYRSCSRENYKAFCELYKNEEVSFEKFKEIIYHYNAQIMNYCLSTGDTYSLPRGMGRIGVQRKKTTTNFTDKNGKTHIILPVNWPETKRIGKKQHYFNDHTDGWAFRWIWFASSSTNLKMKEIWEFIPAKQWSKAITDHVVGVDKSEWLKYPVYIKSRHKDKK